MHSAYGLFIDGCWRATARTFENRNPAKPADLVGEFAAASPDDVHDACIAARAAAAGWRRTSPVGRGEILYRAANLLEARAESTAAELTREEGKTLTEARAEVLRGSAILRFFAGEAAQPVGSVHPSVNATTFLYSIREPIGVISIITPWNFPIAIPLWKLAPALAFGNTLVFKPSELTPLSAVRLVEILAEAGLPPGVLNLVTGLPTDIGDAVTGDEEVDGISFTGSLAVGRSIQVKAVPRGVKVQLELGGKNPVVVLADADVNLAVEKTLTGAMLSAGQKCTATSRAIVVSELANRFTEALLERARALRVGDPFDETIQIGPLVSEAQLDRVVGYLDVARAEGHRLALGGSRLQEADGGYFVEPTVYLDVDPASRIGREEIFGPVLGILHAESFEHAVEIANSVEYGLSASIFTRDIGRAFDFIREVEAGVVHVNSETSGAEPQVPFGGMKASSSHSREQGKAAIEFYTETKTVYLDMPQSGVAESVAVPDARGNA